MMKATPRDGGRKSASLVSLRHHGLIPSLFVILISKGSLHITPTALPRSRPSFSPSARSPLLYHGCGIRYREGMANPVIHTDESRRRLRENEQPRSPGREPAATTVSGRSITPLYTAEDLGEQLTLGRPGQYPFTRGVHESMYRGRFWTMRQFAGFGTPGRRTSGSSSC